jgi:acetoacetate decarboxylase
MAQAQRATVKGKTSDSLSTTPLSFSGIRIFKSQEKKLATESVANESGNFSIELNYGRYYAQVDFMGYKPYKTAEFIVSREQIM